MGSGSVCARGTVLTFGFYTRVGIADEPIAVLADMGSSTVCARSTVLTFGFYTRVGVADEPVAVLADMGSSTVCACCTVGHGVIKIASIGEKYSVSVNKTFA